MAIRARIASGVLIVSMAVAARLVLAAAAGFHPPKPLEYSVIAEHLNAGQGFAFEQYGVTYRAWKEPLYIYMLAAVMRMAPGSGTALLMLHGAFGALAALGVAWLAWLIYQDQRIATLAGLIAALNPFLVTYDARWVHPLSLDSLLFVLMSGTILWAAQQPRGVMGRSVLAGLVAGIALWQRSTLLIAGLSAWMAAVWLMRGTRAAMLRGLGVWLVTSLLIISPWLIRNYALFDRVLMTTDAAHVMWLGNNPASNGTYSDSSGRRVIEFADAALSQQLASASEIGQADAFAGAAFQFIADHPGRFAQLTLRRLWAFVWFSPNAGVDYAPWQDAIYRLTYLASLVAGIWGGSLFWRRAGDGARRAILILVASVAGIAAVHAVTAINLKHRVPLELLLAVCAAESLRWCLRRGFAKIQV